MGYGKLDKSTGAIARRRWAKHRNHRFGRIVLGVFIINLFVIGSVLFLSRTTAVKAEAAPSSPKIIYADTDFYDISSDGRCLTVTFIDNMVDGYEWKYGMDLSDRVHQMYGFEAETTGIEIPESDSQHWIAMFTADEKMIGPVEIVFLYEKADGSDIAVTKHLKLNVTADYRIQVVK